MLIGIDLGTTYSCVAYVDNDGMPCIIPNAESSETTPSVIWFDGRASFVGKKANDRKITPTSPIYEFVKRDIGKPRQINTKYEVNGYYYGAMGMSAIILRKLKKDAFLFFKRKELVSKDAEEKNTAIPAVITVPAFFGDLQRHETRIAGYAAGLNVVAIINEPTAAALAYGKAMLENKRVLVFDLGGGTFDVTILHIKEGEGIVVASDGADQLGGKDWDELILDYLYSEFRKRTGKDIPDDMGWEIQQKAVQAKFDLTDQLQTTVVITNEGEDVEIVLYRYDENPNTYDDFDMDDNRPFYFEERSENLLTLCKTICSLVLEKAGLGWNDIDDIVMAGGSCKMPMVPQMLEDMANRKIPRNIPGFSYDTAIAIGAALYGNRRTIVKDVTSKTIGVEVKINGRQFIEHLIPKNKLLPVIEKQQFKAESNAILKIYEGESSRPEECILRGRLELGNPEGEVMVTLSINEDGVLSSVVEYPPDARKELIIQNDDGEINRNELRNKIGSIDIRL